MHVRAVAVTELARIGGPWAIGDLQRLRGRRRGQHLATDIDEAIEAIRARELGETADLGLTGKPSDDSDVD